MQAHNIHTGCSVQSNRGLPRVAVIGGGIAGLSSARELHRRGYDPVVFEASDRPGGRCSSRATRVGWFDDGAQVIHKADRLAGSALQRPDELAITHPWMVAEAPTDEGSRSYRRDEDKDESDLDTRHTLRLVGAVGVPSMLALAHAVAAEVELRLSMPIRQAWRRGGRWVLADDAGADIDEDFQALVLAMPAPAALPLASESPMLNAALRTVRYGNRWVLLLGAERSVGLPGYREFQGCPIERIAAMHSKPGRGRCPTQRWFVEADARWSARHADHDADTVADLLLENFCAHARRPVLSNFLCAHQWTQAFVETPATTARRTGYLWDGQARLGICGDSVVASQVDRVHRSGLALAEYMAAALKSRREPCCRAVHELAPRPNHAALSTHG